MGTAILTKAGAKLLGYEWLANKKVTFNGIDSETVLEVFYGNLKLGESLEYKGNDPGLVKVYLGDGTPIT